MSELLNWLSTELETWTQAGLRRQRREVQPLSPGRILIDGQEVWDFASNDYLNLASDPRVVSAASEALHSHGAGAKASPLVSGRSDWHARLEQTLADFEGAEAAILFPTGMAANIGTVAALASAEDVVFCDRLNHASLIDGCRLSGAKFRVYRHDDLKGLRRSLERETGRRKWIVTDTVFSMDGDLAPLPELCELAQQNHAGLIVDEAHGTGVFGTTGRGVAELQHVEHLIDVRIGTLSKSLGTLGGFVTGSQILIDYLWNKARTQVYSTALPPSICAAATTAIQILRSEPFRRERLNAMSITFRERLLQRGVTPLEQSVGPIVPIVLKEPAAAIRVADQLRSSGFLVGAIRPPTVPQGTSRLRITLHAETPDEIVVLLADRVAQACESITAHS